MSFSEEVRAELAAIEPRRACCRLAELAALARGSGTLHLRGGGKIALHLDVGSAAVARRSFTLLRAFGVPAEVLAYRRPAFGREGRFQLRSGEDARALQTLHEAGVLDSGLAPLDAPPRRLVARSCCRAAYLRGAFLASGSASGPRDAHLELRAATPAGAAFLASVAAAEGLRLGLLVRRGHAAAYAKGAETIAELLGFTGAHEAALALGEHAVVAATRARANRLANADHANLVRASRAASAQLAAIRRLERAGALADLPPDLREVAELRLRYPFLALSELAARCAPPATKVALHRRLKRLERLATGDASAG